MASPESFTTTLRYDARVVIRSRHNRQMSARAAAVAPVRVPIGPNTPAGIPK